MAGSTKAVRIGIIAEEKNDVDVLYELTCKMVKASSFSFSSFVGHGCGALRKKCKTWAQNLVDRGCSVVVVVHDLDRRSERSLRAMLERELDGVRARLKVVLIPVQELEAWLLSDPEALKVVFSMKKVPKITECPETIPNPKEFLAKLIRQNSAAQYLNTVHNKRIANSLSIAKLGRCPSFSRYPDFLKRAMPKGALLVG